MIPILVTFQKIWDYSQFFFKLWNKSHPILPSNDFKRNLEKKSKCSPWLIRSTWSRPHLFLLPHFLTSSPLIPFQSNWPYCCSLNTSNTSQAHRAFALDSCCLELFTTTPSLFSSLSSFPVQSSHLTLQALYPFMNASFILSSLCLFLPKTYIYFSVWEQELKFYSLLYPQCLP